MRTGARFLLATAAVVAAWRLASEAVDAARPRAATNASGGAGAQRLGAVEPVAIVDTPAPPVGAPVAPVRVGTAASGPVADRWVRSMFLRAVLVSVALIGLSATIVATMQPPGLAAWLMMGGGVLMVVGTLGGLRLVRHIRLGQIRMARGVAETPA